jgi:predicted membrane chloride channel (bestrophin family)
MIDRLIKNQKLAMKAFAGAMLVILFKLGAHWIGWEMISLNPLFSGIVGANVFLMGFLLSGVLSDYKESERLPGELAAILEMFAEEAATLHGRSKNPAALDFLRFIHGFAGAVHSWFYKKEKTFSLMNRLSEFSRHFAAIEPLIPVNHIVRMKQEQQALRRFLIRIHTIRETDFISSGYLIAELTTLLLGIGLILSRIDPFYESLFIVGLIMFMMIFLILLIRDLDNPFGYYEGDSSVDVSLKPIEDCIARISSALERAKSGSGSAGGR